MSETRQFDPHPARKYRWVFQSPGIESFRVKSVFQRADRVIEVETFVLSQDDLAECPISSRSANVKLLDAQGAVIAEAKILWERTEYLPLHDLDYSKSDHLTVKSVLHGVEICWE